MKPKQQTPEQIQLQKYVDGGAYHWRLDERILVSFKQSTIYRRVYSKITELNPKRIADVGCGDGYFTSVLLQNFWDVVGVDYSYLPLSFAKLKLNGRMLVQGDAKNLPFKPESFDLVCCVETLEHNNLKNIPEIIKQIHQSLKEGGRLILTVPSVNIPLSKQHYSHFSKKSLESQLRVFSNVDIEGICCYETMMFDFFFRSVSNKLWQFSRLRTFLCNQVYNRFYANCKPEEASSLMALCQK